MTRRSALTLRGLLLGLLVAGCVTTGPGGEKSVVIISSAQEVAMGQEMDQEIQKQEKLLPDSAWQRYLADVGKKIVGVCDRRDIEYHFHVIESPDINAFAIPGGYVYFYTGILREMENEAQLAAVMAHEISHVVARHGVKQMQTVLGLSVVLQIALGDAGQLTQQAVSVALGLALNGYGRSMESEADRYGVIYMTAAGYNPTGAVQMFEKLAELSGSGGGVFEKLLSTHPETAERIASIRTQVSQMPGHPGDLPYFADRYQQMRARLPAPEGS